MTRVHLSECHVLLADDEDFMRRLFDAYLGRMKKNNVIRGMGVYPCGYRLLEAMKTLLGPVSPERIIVVSDFYMASERSDAIDGLVLLEKVWQISPLIHATLLTGTHLETIQLEWEAATNLPLLQAHRSQDHIWFKPDIVSDSVSLSKQLENLQLRFEELLRVSVPM